MKLLTLISVGNLALAIVPAVILAASRSGILADVKTGICTSVNPEPSPVKLLTLISVGNLALFI